MILRGEKKGLHCVLSFPVCTVSYPGDPFPQCAHWGLPLRGGSALRGEGILVYALGAPFRGAVTEGD